MLIAFSSMKVKDVRFALDIGHNCFLQSFGVNAKDAEKYIKLFNQYTDRKIYFFVDSGAYSVAHSGKEVNIHEYADKLQHLKNLALPHIEIYPFNLDVIPLKNDKRSKEQILQQSMDNYFTLLKLGHPTIQVLHYYDPYEFWQEITTKCTHLNFYALGGSTKINSKEKRRWMLQAIGDLPEGSRIHLLGCTDRYILEDVPCTSTDSTSMTMFNIYGIYLNPESIEERLADDYDVRDGYHPLFSTGKNYELGTRLGIRHFITVQRHINSLWERRFKYLKHIGKLE